MDSKNYRMEDLLNLPVYTPLKAGKYTCRIEKVGLNLLPAEDSDQENELKALGFYVKDQPENKNNNYIRLDLITPEGKRINKNVFPEGLQIAISNIKRQLNIEEDMTSIQVLTKVLTEKPHLNMWVWYNNTNKNVDFYDAEEAKDQQEIVNETIVNSLI